MTAPFIDRAAPYLLAAALLLYAVFAVYGPARNLHGNDFKHLYLGTCALADGKSPYPPESLFEQARLRGMPEGLSLNPYVYLPFTGHALAFLTLLRYEAAQWLFFLVNHVLALGCAALLAPHLARNRLAGAALFVALLAVCHPFHRTLTAGQLNVVLLAVYVLALRALLAGSDRTGGILLGFGALFKLSPGLFFLHFILRRRWRALAAMTATAVCLGLLSVILAGWAVHTEFLPMLRQMGYGRSTWEEHGATFFKDPANQSLNSLFTHLLVAGNRVTAPWVMGTQAAANAATAGVTVALLLVWALAVVRWVNAPPDPRGTVARVQATICLTLLIPSLMWDHYLTQALLPLALLAPVAFGPGHAAVRWVRGGLWVALAAAVCVPWPYEAMAFRTGPGILLMSAKLYAVLVLFAVWCGVALRGRDARGGA